MLERRVVGDVRDEAPRRAARRRRRAALRGVPHARRLRRARTRSSITAAGRTRSSRRRRRTAGRRRRRRPTRRRARSRKRHYRVAEARRDAAARRSTRACRCSSTRRHARRRHADRADDPAYFANGDGDELFFVHEGGGIAAHACSATCAFAAGRLRVRAARAATPLRARRRPQQHWLVDRVRRRRRACPSSCATRSASCAWTRRTRTATSSARRSSGRRDEGIRTRRGQARRRLPRLRAATHSPLDVVGWDGTVYPWAFPILNFQPRVASVHLPPTWHGTFAARGALICSFVPRLLDFHPDAIPCPYPHSSRRLRRVHLLRARQLHVAQRRGAGQHLAPSRRASRTGRTRAPTRSSIGATRTDELAVMLDTFLPLSPTAAALGVEDPAYHASFL